MGKLQEPSVPSSVPGSHPVQKRALSFLSPIEMGQGGQQGATAPERFGHLLAEASVHTTWVSSRETRQAVALDWSRGLIKQHRKFYTPSFTPQHNSHTSPSFILSWLLLKSLSLAPRL